MNTTANSYQEAERPLTALVEAMAPQAWSNASPCDGWSAADVLAHVVETQRDFLTRHDVDLGDAPDVRADPAAAWRDHTKRVAEAVSDDEVAARPFDGHFGPTTVGATLEQFYVWDMVVHRWDIAQSVGADGGWTDTELDQVERGAESFGEALHSPGVCQAGVEAPADGDRTARLLARLGRRA